MAEYTDITKTGPLTGQQLAQQNNSDIQYIPGQGPQITPAQQQAIDNAYRKKYTVPQGSQRSNNAKISTKAEREKWWEDEGRKDYFSQFNDVSIDKRGEFTNRELERIYRNTLFRKEFEKLPEYNELIEMSGDERDSFYTYWRGRVNEPVTYEKDGKKYPVPFVLNPDNFANNPEGREAGRILADLNYYFGQNFDNWTNEERKKFYDDWEVATKGTGKFAQAAQENPDLRKKDFKSQQDIDNFLKSAFDNNNAAKVGRENVQVSSDTMSVNNPSSMDSFIKVNNAIYDSDATRVQAPITSLSFASQEDIQRWADQAEYEYEHKDEIEAAKKEDKKQLDKYEQEWYKFNPVHHIWQTGTEEHPFQNRKAAARAYAKEQLMLAKMTPSERKEYDAKQKRLEVFRQEYRDNTASYPFFRFDINGKPRFAWDASINAAEYYAQERNAVWERQHSTIPQEQNPFAFGVTLNDIPTIVSNLSGIYQEFNGSNWMPENEIPWNDIYNRTKDLWESGHIEEAIYQTDKIIENEVISKNQKAFGRDNLGHASSMEAAWNNFYSMGVESLLEGATFVPSMIVGLGQAAFNPSELQTESGMNFFDRALDNAIHNDWLGLASNQSVSDWAAEIMENNVVYGNNFGEQLLSGAGTFGAQVGNLIMFTAGGLEAKAARALMKDAAKAAERVAKKEIVDAGKLAKYNMQINKTVDNLNLFKANYGEAMQQSLEGERQIYQEGESRKKELIKKYRPKVEYITETDGVTAQQIIKPFEHHYTQEELEEAFNLQPNAKAWKAYLTAIQNGEAAVPPEEGVSVEAFLDKVARDAEGLHRLYQEVPDYNDNVALNAKLKANTDLVTQTTLLFGFDRLFGGLDKWTLDFASGRRALKPKDLVGKIKGTTIGNLRPNKQLLKGAWTVAQNPVMEAITEEGQQSGSAITKQIAEHNINSFLENQLYGNGLQSWAATNYEGLYNLDWEEFGRDAEIKRTLTQTLLTTPLMPVLGGYRNRSTRGQNQSWISRALENIHYYSPIKTTLGEQIYNIGQHNKQLQAAVDYINRWGADPVNQANTRGLIGIQNYTEKMIADLINNDEVAYNNDLFSRTLSEAIMLANTQGTEFSQNRLQWLTNMSQIKSATAEQKAAAIQSMREEATGNSAVRNLSDEELLNLMESSSKKVLDTYNKVNDIISSDERFTDGTYNWQQQSALIFNRMAREDLNTRVADKENRIQAAIQSLGEIDLGESKISKEKVEDNKVKNKKVLLSGRDILALSPMKRAAMLSPKNLKSYSPEQQKIIQETINALNQVDGNILNDIRNAGLEEYHLMQIEKDYKASLQTPNWQSKRVKNKAEKIKKAFTTEGNTKTFKDRITQAQSVADVYNAIVSEREANATRDSESVINIEGILNSVQDSALKQKINEAKKIERTVNAIKSRVDSSNLPDDVKDNLFNQIDRIANESFSAAEVTDISKYSIPILPDGRDISGDLSGILQTAAQNVSNTQTVESEPIKPVQNKEDLPKSTDLGDRDVDTAIPVNDNPLKKYTKDEARDKLQELDDLLIEAYTAENSHQHDTILVKVMALRDDLEKRLPEGWGVSKVPDYKIHTEKGDFLVFKLYDLPTEVKEQKPQTEDKKDDITDINSRKEEPKQPIDRDGITKVAEILFEKEGRVYSYPIRDEDVRLGDGVNGPFSRTGRVINIRDVQDDAEAEFLIYQTDKKGNFKINNKGERIKRERPQFIDRHSQIQSNSAEEQVIYEDDKTRNSISTETKDGITTTKVTTFRKDKNKNTTFGATPINSDVVAPEYRETYETEDVEKVEYYIEEVREDSNGNIDGTIGVKITYKDGTTSTTSHIAAKLNYNPFKQQTATPPTKNPPTTGSTGGRYSNRTEYQQSVIDNNITPAVTELEDIPLRDGLFVPNTSYGQPNVIRQLQEEGAFDYMNKGALNEGDEIEFIVSQEQMPDGATQVVIWEVTEPKDGVERTNPKWHGKQLLNVLDQTEVEGKRKELIDRIRKAYEEAGRPESFLYPNERFVVDNISNSILPFKQTNPTEASSEETIESTNLQKGLTKQNGVWGISFFNKAKGKMVHVPVIFRQAKKDRSGSTRTLFSDSRMKSKTINIRKTAVGGTGEMNTVSMVLPTPKGFVSVNSVYILTRDIPNSSDKYKESIRTGSVGKALISKIKAHLNDIKTVSAFSDYLGFRRGYSEYIYNDRNHGRIDLGYRGSTGNNTLVSAIPQNGKYVLVDSTDARNILNDNNGQGFTLDEVCKEYLTQLVDNPEAKVTMRLNMEAIESKPEIITDLIDDGLLWAPDSLNARFTAANTQFICSLTNETKPIEPKKETPKQEQPKETPKPAPVASSNNPSSTTEPVKKTQPKVDDSVELGSKVRRRKLKVGQSTQVRPEVPTTPTSTPTTISTSTSSTRTFETLSEKDKQHILTKVTKEEWNNLTKEEQDNILNC